MTMVMVSLQGNRTLTKTTVIIKSFKNRLIICGFNVWKVIPKTQMLFSAGYSSQKATPPELQSLTEVSQENLPSCLLWVQS